MEKSRWRLKTPNSLFKRRFTCRRRPHILRSLISLRQGLQNATLRLDCKTDRIFAYSSTREQSNKTSGTRRKTESETGFFSLASHARRACEARAVRAHKNLTPRVTDFFTDFEEKTDCFAVYPTTGILLPSWLSLGMTRKPYACVSLEHFQSIYNSSWIG